MRAPEFWGPRPPGRHPGPWPFVLAPVACGWAIASRLRQHVARSETVGVPVICVGNLVTGGAGKTPTALALLQRLRDKGINVHCLSRGYGGIAKGPLRVDRQKHGAGRVGDEALLLAEVAPTWVGRDRLTLSRAAIAGGAELLVLDDGYQDPCLKKDLSLVVVDGDYGFGNGWVMPSGPLREPLDFGLARADGLVWLGEQANGLAALPPGLLVLRARLKPAPEAARFAGAAVVAFAGIGRPEKFFATLKEIGCRVVRTQSFPDHHYYEPAEIRRLAAFAAAARARLVTTAKDWVRLSVPERPLVEMVEVTLEFDDSSALDRFLDPVLVRFRGHVASR